MTNTTTNNTPSSLPAPIDVLRELDRFEAAMRRAFDYTPERNAFGDVVPHAEEAYQRVRDSDRFMGFCLAVAAGSGGKVIAPEALLEIARAAGLRSFLHGVNAPDARGILARYQRAVDEYRESLPAAPERQVSGWVYDATRKALDAVHEVALEFGCPRGATVSDWLRERLSATQQPEPREAIMFEHDDGRYAVAPSAEVAHFTRDEPAWHRVGPVAVYGFTGAQPEPRAEVTDDDVISACDAHGITLPVDAVGPATSLINLFTARAVGAA
ncbi:hypothetical protein DIE15_08220 [Burkholderia sp. Bp9031]|uniref:hypothetical protein n=1 Tax=Burkholderia sp. Bp9031 TaxID=2184566 RepID=UPI000F5D9FC9|nr:hypothetical protein [Burkholderia sp. Bp9031]RQZ18109.1 hypothetical protein DIE15_08220 [Burkholderia sp. Bp9031]